MNQSRPLDPTQRNFVARRDMRCFSSILVKPPRWHHFLRVYNLHHDLHHGLRVSQSVVTTHRRVVVCEVARLQGSLQTLFCIENLRIFPAFFARWVRSIQDWNPRRRILLGLNWNVASNQSCRRAEKCPFSKIWSMCPLTRDRAHRKDEYKHIRVNIYVNSTFFNNFYMFVGIKNRLDYHYYYCTCSSVPEWVPLALYSSYVASIQCYIQLFVRVKAPLLLGKNVGSNFILHPHLYIRYANVGSLPSRRLW
jgi:hypothetical protein